MKVFTILAGVLLSLQVWATDPMTLKVEGMTCHSCEQSIQDSVSKVPGVKSCKADHAAGTVTIETDGKTPVDAKAVTAAIKKAGKQFVVK
jgi:copper chaperone CopZ